MANKVNNAAKKGTVLFAKRPDHAVKQELVGSHIVPGRNGKPDHVALDFANGASVIYPNGWTPNFDIVIGNVYDAGWDGNGHFQMKAY